MDLGESRSSSLTKSQLKSTRGSFFKSTGREVKANWGNRFNKDFNDLDYDVTLDNRSHINKFKYNQPIKTKQKAEKQSKCKETPMTMSVSLDRRVSSRSRKSRNRSQRHSLVHNPQRINISRMESSDHKYYGLSPFEYSNTIEGNVKRKSSRHLQMRKQQVQRPSNYNPIYYNRHQDIDFSFSQALSQRKELKKYHPFASYLDRKVFEPKDQLDKFYDEDDSRKAASPHRQRQVVRNFDLLTGRQEPHQNESASLTFDTVPCIAKLKKKSQSYSIPKTQRQTAFSRQIIDQKRGCYR